METVSPGTPSSISETDHNEGDLSSVQNALIESFQQICSLEQMDLCQKTGLLSKSEQQQAYKMAKALIEQRQLPVSSQDWNHLTEWVLMLRDRYSHQLEQQCIRTHETDAQRITHLDEIQKLSSMLEEYGQAHDDLTDLLQALKKLRNEWKHRKKDVENIVLSILASLPLGDTCRVVKVGRSHLGSLGLGLSSLNKHYIVFEPGLTEDASRRDILNNVAKDFGLVFQENAAQNLARMAGSYHRIFQEESSSNVVDQVQTLLRQVYITRPNSVILPYPTSLPTSPPPVPPLPSTSTSTPQQENVNRKKRESTFLERRKSIIIVEDNGLDPTLFNMAKPVFEPAGWDWPRILKHKQPNHSISYWCQRIIPVEQEKEKGIWSTSISRLSEHFTKVGYEYYSNMLNNARLMHSHRAQMFEFATRSLLKCYTAIQLEQGCSNLNRTLVFLYRLQQEPQRA